MRSPNPHFFSLRGLERPLKAAIQRFNDLWDSTGFSQMGRAGVHRPINPMGSAPVRPGVSIIHAALTTPPVHPLSKRGEKGVCSRGQTNKS